MVVINADGAHFSTGEPVALLATGDLVGEHPGGADHETIAVNDAGDVYVTWASFIYGEAATSVRRVEGAFFRRTGLDDWRCYGTHTIMEGGTSASGWTPVYTAGDICRKPDVVSDGTHFFVSAPRIEVGDGSGRLECVLVEVPGTGDAVPHTNSTGIGHIVESSVDPEGAGIMPDVAWDAVNSRFCVAYCALETKQQYAPGTSYDFALKATTVTFASPSATPVIQTPATLATGVAFDDFSEEEGGHFSGGKILPDISFDKHGKLVLVYEEWRRGFRDTYPLDSEDNDGIIHVQRFSISGATFTEVGTTGGTDLHGGTATTLGGGTGGKYAQRRPMVYVGKDSLNEDYAFLTWSVDRRDSGTSLVESRRLDYSSSTGDAVVTDQSPSHIGNALAEVVLPFAFEDDVVYLAGIKPSNPRSANEQSLIAFRRPSEKDWTEISEISGTRPWRVAVDGLENDAYSGAPSDSGKMVMATEGKYAGRGRIHLTIIDDSIIRA